MIAGSRNDRGDLLSHRISATYNLEAPLLYNPTHYQIPNSVSKSHTNEIYQLLPLFLCSVFRVPKPTLEIHCKHNPLLNYESSILNNIPKLFLIVMSSFSTTNDPRPP